MSETHDPWSLPHQCGQCHCTVLWLTSIGPCVRARAEEGDLRLAGGAVAEGGGAEYGRLEVFHRGGWGTVCDIADTLSDNTKPQFDFGQAAADAACRQLGYSEGFPVQPRVRHPLRYRAPGVLVLYFDIAAGLLYKGGNSPSMSLWSML